MRKMVRSRLGDIYLSSTCYLYIVRIRSSTGLQRHDGMYIGFPTCHRQSNVCNRVYLYNNEIPEVQMRTPAILRAPVVLSGIKTYICGSRQNSERCTNEPTQIYIWRTICMYTTVSIHSIKVIIVTISQDI